MRWHSVGRRIVYLAESPAGAMVEILVYLELEEDDLPRSYTLLLVRVPEDLSTEQVSVPPGDAWKADHDLSRQLGDGWFISRTTALARVPSAILPNTTNVLLNPLHPDAERIRILESTRAELNPRLLKHLRG